MLSVKPYPSVLTSMHISYLHVLVKFGHQPSRKNVGKLIFLVTSLTANLIILIFLTPIRQFSVLAGGGGFPEGAPKIKRCKKKKIFRL